MIVYRCDLCGAPVVPPADLTRLAIQRPGQRDYSDDRHLCGACSARLMEWLTSPPGPITAAEQLDVSRSI